MYIVGSHNVEVSSKITYDSICNNIDNEKGALDGSY